MKRLLTLSVGFLFSVTGFTQTCLPEGIYFVSQTQIDSFQYNYPNCSEIEGDVTIFGSNYIEIRNLCGLSVLNSIGGNLSIYLNLALGSLIGLEGLNSIGGDLILVDNVTMVSLIGLDSITSIGGILKITDNFALTSLMVNNNLTSIGGELMIQNNISLTSLSGLNNINAGSISDLYISDNSSLSNCSVQSICDYLASPNGIIDIHDNGQDCNSQGEVEAACGVGFEEKSGLSGNIIIYPNPASTIFTIEMTEFYNQSELTILNLNGQAFEHYQIMEPKTLIDISHWPDGVYFVKFTNSNEFRMFKVIKY